MQSNLLQRLIPLLAVIKLLYCFLNYNYWNMCPWDDEDSRNYIRSFKITIATLFQTMLCLAFLALAMGFKICRESLSRDQTRKMLIIVTFQYFVTSLYSVAFYLPYIGVITSLIINTFSVSMIITMMNEAKDNYRALNFRLSVVRQTYELSHLDEAIQRRKKIISVCILMITSYYACELLFHGILELFFSNQIQTIGSEIVVWVFHELVDFTTIFVLLLAVGMKGPFDDQGEGVIDISNQNIRSELERAFKVKRFICRIDLNTGSEYTLDDKQELKIQKTKDPVIILNPFDEDGQNPHCLPISLASISYHFDPNALTD